MQAPWKTFVLANADEITVAAPETAQSQAYLTEIASLKAAMSSVTAEQKEAVNIGEAMAYCAGMKSPGALAADYNAPTCIQRRWDLPRTDANNPTVYPRFPFANPPYASRALRCWLWRNTMPW